MAHVKTDSHDLSHAFALSIGLFFARWHLAGLVGFGDAEALYAAYALHPQPAYLDHPGLIGSIARLIGDGGAPTPLNAHRVTAVAATLLPWVGFAAARISGNRDTALRTFFALALVPEMSIGLFGLTPDLPLAATWLAALGAAALALRSEPGTRAALAGAVAAGLLAGVAMTAKATGFLLTVTLVAVFASRAGRAHLRTIGPWCGLAVAGILVAPIIAWERAHGLPMLTHRLVATQIHAGLSLRNLGGLVGGQLLYVTPAFLAGAYVVFRELWRRLDDPVNRLLTFATIVPGVPLVVLCSWSRVAEPHWLGPAYLGLALGVARVPAPSAWIHRGAVATGLIAAALGWAVVATNLFPRVAGSRYVARYDLVNDLFVWKRVLPVVREELDELAREGDPGVVVGPHWVVCAQLHAGLGAGTNVGCLTSGGDDFQGWYPQKTWSNARSLLLVSDDRFPADAAAEFPDRHVVRVRLVRIFRADRAVRTVRVVRLDRTDLALANVRGAPTPPRWTAP